MKAARKTLKAADKQPTVDEATIADSGWEFDCGRRGLPHRHEQRGSAGARYLAALAAPAFSDEQMKLVSNANIVDKEFLAEFAAHARETSAATGQGDYRGC